jgi:AraC-like DNA-binding protein
MLKKILRSASNAGEALEQGLRYIRLVNEAADFQLRTHKGRAIVELRSRVPLSRAASDFQSAALVVATRTWLAGPPVAIEASFAHAAPARLDVYRQVYGDGPIRFSAPCDALAFPAHLLEAPIESSDRELNQAVRREAERLIAKLPEPEPLTVRVRKLLLGTLPAGTVSADYIAARLGVSRRTLTRHLEAEQTSFADLLEAARRELAHQHLADRSMDIQQIAYLLGYSETSAFSRAFKRWSGQSPQQYRDGLP